MAVVLDIQSQSSVKDATLHFMPCKISHNDHAPVDRYFETAIRPGDSKSEKVKVVTSSFRGRPLVGCETQVPSGYTGYVLKESRRPFDEEEERNLKMSHKFNSFTYWNLDREPSANDKFQQALAWFDLSKTIHTPITEDPSSKA